LSDLARTKKHFKTFAIRFFMKNTIASHLKISFHADLPTEGRRGVSGALLTAFDINGKYILDNWVHYCDPKNWVTVYFDRNDVLGLNVISYIKNKLYMLYDDNFVPNKFGEHYWREFN